MARKPRIGPDPLPWVPPQWGKAEYYAIKALYAGNANEHQQRLLWTLLMELTGYGDLEFRESERASVFAGGKRHVGLQLVKAVQMPGSIIDRLE